MRGLGLGDLGQWREGLDWRLRVLGFNVGAEIITNTVHSRAPQAYSCTRIYSEAFLNLFMPLYEEGLSVAVLLNVDEDGTDRVNRF